MAKVRIVKRTTPLGRVSFVIQQKHFLFRWWWVDAWVNSMLGASCRDSFDTLEEARKYLPLFDGTKIKDEVIQ